MSRESLDKNIALLRKQREWLQISVDECWKIGIKAEYTIEEFGRFETLCSRFARSVDFLIRKAFRSIDAYEFENQGTLIDVVNNAHKRGFFESIDRMRQIKELRNDIVHEYIEDNLCEIFHDVLEESRYLLGIMDNVLKYTASIG